MKFSFRNFVAEELNDEQKKKVDGWVNTAAVNGPDHQPNPEYDKHRAEGGNIASWKEKTNFKTAAEKISAHVIPHGEHKVVIPLDHSPMSPDLVSAPHDVKQHLEKHGYEIHNYHAGLVKDKYGRQMKLGKALSASKAPPHVVKQFTNDPDRVHSTSTGHQVVISRHPHDVAGMSTDRGWTSCMHMDTGAFRETLQHDIHHGTHVAYLTHKGDDDIKNPIARIALKPLHSVEGDKSHTILRPEPKSYGEGSDDFEHTVHSWALKHFPMNDEHSSYKVPSRLYHDGIDGHMHNHERFANNPHTFTALHEDEQHNILLPITHKPTSRKLINHRVSTQGMPANPEYRALIARDGTDEHREALKDDEHSIVKRSVFNFGHEAHQLHIAKNVKSAGDLNHYTSLSHMNHPKVNHTLASNIKGLFENVPSHHELGDNTAASVRNLMHHGDDETHAILHDSKNNVIRRTVASHAKHPAILSKMVNDEDKTVKHEALENPHTPEDIKLHHLVHGDVVSQHAAMLGLKDSDLSAHIHNMRPEIRSRLAESTTNKNTIKHLADMKNVPDVHISLLSNHNAKIDAAHKFLNHTNDTLKTFARRIYHNNVEPNQAYYKKPSYESALKDTPEHS